MHYRFLAFALAVLTLCTATELRAQQTPDATSEEAVRELRREITARDGIIQRLITRIEQLESRVRQLEARSISSSESENGGEAQASDTLSDSAERLASQEKDEKEIDESAKEGTAPPPEELERREQERLVRTAFERTLVDRGGLLLAPFAFDLGPSFSYIHSSADNIVIDGFTILPVLVVGDIVSEREQRDLLLAAVTARLGLPWDSQIEVRVPFGYQSFRTHSADNEEETASDFGLGDIELALSHQLYRSRSEWPDLLASLRWKSDTGDSPFEANGRDKFVGTGFHSITLSFTAVKVVDPVVFFGGINYTNNLSTNENIGRFNPGDSYGFSLGMAIALNLNSSLSFSYDQEFTSRSELNGSAIPGSYLTNGVFSVGSSYSFTNNFTADFSLGIGVTSDSPDLIFTTSFPFSGSF